MAQNPVLTSGFSLPIANTRSIFQPHVVEARLARLGQHNNELRPTYERMLELGPERFQVKPSGIPEMATLYEQMPNFTEALDDFKRHVVLSQDSSDGIEITPMLLLGPPGIGKTHFSKKIADLLGTGMNLVSMSSMTAGWLLSGASSQWKGAKPGRVFEALIEGQYANPVIVVDEVDKAGRDVQYDPMGALYSLLEHDTAKHFIDEFAEIPIDASQVIWVLTANDERGIPDPIMNRMNVFEVKAPSFEAARRIAFNMYVSIRDGHDWGKQFPPEPTDDVMDVLAKLGPREMRRALMEGFGNTRLNNRRIIMPEDLGKKSVEKTNIGFIQ